MFLEQGHGARHGLQQLETIHHTMDRFCRNFLIFFRCEEAWMRGLRLDQLLLKRVGDRFKEYSRYLWIFILYVLAPSDYIDT